VKRLTFVVIFACLALVATAAPAAAQTPPPDPVIPDDVTVSDVDVSGKTAADATAALLAFFDQPLKLRLGGKTLSVPPGQLGASARISKAVDAALVAPAGSELTLEVVIGPRLKKWLSKRAKIFRRSPVPTKAVLVGLRPKLTKARPGRALVRNVARAQIVAALREHVRDPVALPARTIKPGVTPRNFGPAIVIRRGSHRLVLYRAHGVGRMRVSNVFPVAVGMPAYPTPLGSFTIVNKRRNPWWYPPDEPWAAGASPIPPGPGNPLGTRWMGLSRPGVGIHGTYNSGSVGTSASHGCIRMHIASAEWLFERVRIGTPVWIVSS
jgi:lipoprotein-anchoring transpeptidase ErfK/SrfK